MPKDDITLVDLDRELVRRKGLRGFIRAAWKQVEPSGLIWGWHIDAMSEHLEAVSRGDIKNLLILVPPGCMKTLCVSVFWPSWEWIENPETKWIFSSYGQSLSDKSARQHRNLVASPWYQERWGESCSIADGSVKQVRMFENTGRGFRFSTSVGGEVTGRHADVLVFDDLIKAQAALGRAAVDPKEIEKANDFWQRTMPSREANPQTTRRVGIMQRLHHRDTAQVCLEEGSYEVLRLPMEFEPSSRCSTSIGFTDPRTEEGELLWPDRFDRENVDEKRKALGTRTFEAQYQQRPSPPDGAVFKVQWLQYWGAIGTKYPKLPARNLRFIQSWDCAFKGTDDSDYVVGQIWAQFGADLLLLDQVRGKWSFAETCSQIERFSERWPQAYTKLIEDKANGPAVMSALSGKIGGMLPVNPQGGKEARANAVQASFEAGNVYLPHRSIAPWIEDYEAELLAFPFGSHDDQVDATTQALIKLIGGAGSAYIAAMNNLRSG